MWILLPQCNKDSFQLPTTLKNMYLDNSAFKIGAVLCAILLCIYTQKIKIIMYNKILCCAAAAESLSSRLKICFCTFAWKN